MSHIVLSDEQAEVLKTASDTVEVRDSQGRILALVQPQDRRLAETIQECKRRLASQGPRISAARVQVFLRRLTEVDQQEGMNREKMQELLRQTLAAETHDSVSGALKDISVEQPLLIDQVDEFIVVHEHPRTS